MFVHETVWLQVWRLRQRPHDSYWYLFCHRRDNPGSVKIVILHFSIKPMDFNANLLWETSMFGKDSILLALCPFAPCPWLLLMQSGCDWGMVLIIGVGSLIASDTQPGRRHHQHGQSWVIHDILSPLMNCYFYPVDRLLHMFLSSTAAVSFSWLRIVLVHLSNDGGYTISKPHDMKQRFFRFDWCLRLWVAIRWCACSLRWSSCWIDYHGTDELEKLPVCILLVWLMCDKDWTTWGRG